MSIAPEATSLAAGAALDATGSGALATGSGAGAAGVPRNKYFLKSSASSTSISLYIKPKTAEDISNTNRTMPQRGLRELRLKTSDSVACAFVVATLAGTPRTGAPKTGSRGVCASKAATGAASCGLVGVDAGAGAGPETTVAEAGAGAGAGWAFLPSPGIRQDVFLGILSCLSASSESCADIGCKTGGSDAGAASGVSATQSDKTRLGSPALVSTSHCNRFLPNASNFLW